MLQSKLGRWGWLVQKLQVKDPPGEQGELENLYSDLNSLLSENETLEKKNLELQGEMNALRLRNDLGKEDVVKNAVSEFAGDMVLVADNIRRAIEAIPKEQLGAIPALDSLVEGFEVTERSLLTALNRYQVTRFDPLGEPFNPHLHEAKFMLSAPDLPANTVVQVIHAGFMIGERLLRPAGVAVSQIGAVTQAQDGAAADNWTSPALPGATGPVRKSSVLHKPVITAADGSPHERVEDTSSYIRASGYAKAITGAQERTKAVNDAFEAKNYTEAARLQERNAEEIRRTETAAEGKPGDGTLDALLSLSWFQLFAGQYDTVIATADQAAAIRDDYISIDANRAHALMLKGYVDEARIIYNKHYGKETRNKKTWDDEILDDFSEFEQENINHKLMNEIRSAWAKRN